MIFLESSNADASMIIRIRYTVATLTANLATSSKSNTNQIFVRNTCVEPRNLRKMVDGKGIGGPVNPVTFRHAEVSPFRFIPYHSKFPRSIDCLTQSSNQSKSAYHWSSEKDRGQCLSLYLP